MNLPILSPAEGSRFDKPTWCMTMVPVLWWPVMCWFSGKSLQNVEFVVRNYTFVTQAVTIIRAKPVKGHTCLLPCPHQDP